MVMLRKYGYEVEVFEYVVIICILFSNMCEFIIVYVVEWGISGGCVFCYDCSLYV